MRKLEPISTDNERGCTVAACAGKPALRPAQKTLYIIF
jgi:hypothetical protein